MKLGDAFDKVKEIVDYAAETPEHLTEWQQEFINSYGVKVLNFEDECFISMKQLDQLNKVAEALGLDQISEGELDE